jgi:hypothetical protein
VVGFVLTPLASNSSEFVSSLTFAARKKRKNMSLTLSQVRVSKAGRLQQQEQHGSSELPSCMPSVVCLQHFICCAGPRIVACVHVQKKYQTLQQGCWRAVRRSLSCLELHRVPCLSMQVYGAVTMNNTLVLGLFLVVVYLRRLEWWGRGGLC